MWLPEIVDMQWPLYSYIPLEFRVRTLYKYMEVYVYRV